MKKLIFITTFASLVTIFYYSYAKTASCSWWTQIFRRCWTTIGGCECNSPVALSYGHCVQEWGTYSWLWGSGPGGFYTLCSELPPDDNPFIRETPGMSKIPIDKDIPKSNREIMLKLQSIGMKVTEQDVANMRVKANQDSPGCCE